ncbi:hypothetical protein TNCT_196521 [Trichonephila clavata]|uniref:Uncharacterized protein n=1 Tax=Trichonephila clavata TaxID=2740835 RepID=A0A8X6JG86_TRICU|nr:hypothetical protein TNCT_196521 [Trichonephila clavata]
MEYLLTPRFARCMCEGQKRRDVREDTCWDLFGTTGESNLFFPRVVTEIEYSADQGILEVFREEAFWPSDSIHYFDTFLDFLLKMGQLLA